MSQSLSLMYFLDRIAALNEMWRVPEDGAPPVRDCGVGALFERATAYVLLTEITKSSLWVTVRDRSPHRTVRLGRPRKGDLHLFKLAAGIDEVAVELHQGTMKFPSIEVFGRRR